MDFRISNTGLTKLLDSSLSLSSSSVKSNGTLDSSELWRRIRAAEESWADSGRSGGSSLVKELSELKRRVRPSETVGIVRVCNNGNGWLLEVPVCVVGNIIDIYYLHNGCYKTNHGHLNNHIQLLHRSKGIHSCVGKNF